MIEDNFLLTCADLVQNCVVVGHYKHAIVLFVEPAEARALKSEEAGAALKKEVLTRTAEFTGRLFGHERITVPEQIVLVKQGSLPRTAVSLLLSDV
jgi:hypothetical protein